MTERIQNLNMNNWDGIVSLLVACIELVLLINLLIFAEKNRTNIFAIIIVAVLMIYQSLEFLMCQIGLETSSFPYLAFVDISLLPPLNLLMMLTLLNYNFKFNSIIFLPAVAFIIYFSFVIDQFFVTSCTVTYATYNYPLGDLYGFFYYLPILISIILIILSLRKTVDSRKKIVIKILLFGNLFISIPVITGFILMYSGNYSVITKIESIMCKFAFVYALCLTLISLYNSKRKNERNYT